MGVVARNSVNRGRRSFHPAALLQLESGKLVAPESITLGVPSVLPFVTLSRTYLAYDAKTPR